MVAFCSPAESLTFNGFNRKPISWQKVKVLTSKQNAPNKTRIAEKVLFVGSCFGFHAIGE